MQGTTLITNQLFEILTRTFINTKNGSINKNALSSVGMLVNPNPLKWGFRAGYKKKAHITDNDNTIEKVDCVICNDFLIGYMGINILETYTIGTDGQVKSCTWQIDRKVLENKIYNLIALNKPVCRSKKFTGNEKILASNSSGQFALYNRICSNTYIAYKYKVEMTDIELKLYETYINRYYKSVDIAACN